jgi:hypothetical protein
MVNLSLLQTYKGAFDADGFLRDIYVFQANENNWQTLVNYLRSTTIYPISFLIDQENQPLPSTVRKIFDLKNDHSVILHIDEGQLNLCCYFFTSEQIEFDFDPRDINSDQRFTRLLDFIHHLGNLLQKPVVLTPESTEDIHYLLYDPITMHDSWSLPEWET